MKNDKVNKIAASIMATGMIIGVSAMPAMAYDADAANTNSSYSTRDYEASSGTFKGAVFERTYLMSSSAGRYINFYIENRGTAPVTFKINNEVSRTLLPGQSGHISVTAPTASTKNYTFRADSGNSMYIYYKIAQRDVPTN